MKKNNIIDTINELLYERELEWACYSHENDEKGVITEYYLQSIHNDTMPSCHYKGHKPPYNAMSAHQIWDAKEHIFKGEKGTIIISNNSGVFTKPTSNRFDEEPLEEANAYQYLEFLKRQYS